MSWMTAIFYFFIFRILLQYPYLLAALVLAYVLRDRIPSPSEYFRRRKAFARLNRDVELNPYNSEARRDLGMIYLAKGMPKEALEHFREALKKEADSAEINHFVGLSLLRTGKPDEAVVYLEKSIQIDPKLKYGESYLYLGEARFATGKTEAALENLKTFLARYNSSIEGLYYYATALNTLGRKEEARKAAEDGIRYHKANPSFRRKRDWRWNVKLKRMKRTL
ncbi:MAG: tetratricopeptide repeat protein [Nitrospirae bacterium]|nr:tetratricopeptide repeat protein [Nitrospirota bacterium]